MSPLETKNSEQLISLNAMLKLVSLSYDGLYVPYTSVPSNWSVALCQELPAFTRRTNFHWSSPMSPPKVYTPWVSLASPDKVCVVSGFQIGVRRVSCMCHRSCRRSCHRLCHRSCWQHHSEYATSSKSIYGSCEDILGPSRSYRKHLSWVSDKVSHLVSQLVRITLKGLLNGTEPCLSFFQMLARYISGIPMHSPSLYTEHVVLDALQCSHRVLFFISSKDFVPAISACAFMQYLVNG